VKHFTWVVQPQGRNLNEIGGSFYKQWSMWLNLMKRSKPYQYKTVRRFVGKNF